MAGRKLDEAYVEISARLDGYERGVRVAREKTDRATKKMAASFKRVKAGVGGLTSAIRGYGLAATAATAGVSALIIKSFALAESLNDSAIQVGVAVEALQLFQFAATQNGSSAQKMTDGLTRLQRRIGQFTVDGTGPAVAGIEALGLATDITSGKLQGTEAVFRAVIKGLEGVEDVGEKAAIASAFFGDRAGPELLATLRLGTQGMKEFEERARSLGYIMDGEMVAKAAAVNARMRSLRETIQNQVVGAVIELADEVEDVGEAFAEALPHMVSFVQNLIAGFGKVSRAIGGTIDDLRYFLTLFSGIDTEGTLGDVLGGKEGIRRATTTEQRSDALASAEEQVAIEEKRLGNIRKASERASEAESAAYAEVVDRQTKRLDEAVAKLQRLREVVTNDPVPVRLEPFVVTPPPTFTPTPTGAPAPSGGGGGGSGSSGGSSAPSTTIDDLTDEAIKQAERLAEAEQLINDTILAGLSDKERLAREIANIKDLRAEMIEVLGSEAEAERVLGEAIALAQEKAAEGLSELEDLGESVGQALGNAFQGVTKDLISADGAGRNFGDTLRNLGLKLADVVLQAAVFKPLQGLATDLFGSVLTGLSGARASGGPVASGKAYLVGEKRPEVFVPSQNGTIEPSVAAYASRGGAAGERAGAVSVSQTVNISAGVGPTVRAEVSKMLPELEQTLAAGVAERAARGGAFGRQLRGA